MRWVLYNFDMWLYHPFVKRTQRIVITLQFFIIFFVSITGHAAEFVGGAYNLRVYIDETMPYHEEFLPRLESALDEMCRYLHEALRRQAKCGQITVLVPEDWECPLCLPDPAISGVANDIYIGPNVTCGEAGALACASAEVTGGIISIDDSVVMERDPLSASKALVHEWGHYRYGLGDEYARDLFLSQGSTGLDFDGNPLECVEKFNHHRITVDVNGDLVPATSGLPHASIMYDQNPSRITEFCDDSDNSLYQHNPDAMNNHNLRHDGKSSWAVIEQHGDGLRQSGGSTVGYSSPLIELKKKPQSTAMLVIDVSGSMQESGLIGTARAAGIGLIQTAEAGTKIGVVAFAESASLLLAPTEIVDVKDEAGQVISSNRGAIASALPGSALEDTWTSIGSGMLAALSQFNCASFDELKLMVVLTDGGQNRGLGPGDVNLASCRVYLYHIGLSPAALPFFSSRGTSEEGALFEVPENDPSALNSVLTHIISKTKQRPGQMIFKRRVEVQRGEVTTLETVIEPDLGQKTLFRFFTPPSETGEDINDYAVSMQQPDETWIDNSYAGYTRDALNGVVEFAISEIAQSGLWKVYLSGNVDADGAVVHAQVTSFPRDKSVPPIQVHPKISTQKVTHPNPILITARLHKGGDPVGEAATFAVVRDPSGNKTNLPLQDNGQGADHFRGDGVYSSYFTQYTGDGFYDVEVQVNPVVSGNDSGHCTLGGTSGQRLDYKFSRVVPVGSFELTGYTPGDHMPPDKVTSLVPTEITKTSAKFSWIGTGDDYGNGKPAQCVLRYSKEKIDSPQKFSEAAVGKTITSPKDPHNVEEEVVSGLEEGATYYFALVCGDEAGNQSTVSNKIKVDLSKASAETLTDSKDGPHGETPPSVTGETVDPADIKPADKEPGGCSFVPRSTTR